MLRRKEIDTWEAKIYVGNRKGSDADFIIYESDVKDAIRKFQTVLQFPIRITKTDYLLSERDECGWEITSIRYPHDPKNKNEIKEFLERLTLFLMKELGQKRILMVLPEKTIIFMDD